MKLQWKRQRLEAVSRGLWRIKGGKMLDLYNENEVDDKYLTSLINDSANKERLERTGIDEQIMNKLLEIRKTRIENKQMKTEQIEMDPIVKQINPTTQTDSVDAAKAAASISLQKPRFFNVGDIVGKYEVLGFEKSNKGKIKGWVYTLKNKIDGKIFKMKQGDLAKSKKIIRASENEPTFLKFEDETPVEIVEKKTKKNETSSENVLKHTFPKVRKIKNRYVCDSRYNKDYPQGDTEFFESKKAAFDRAEQIEKNINAAKNKAAPKQVTVESQIKRLSFFQKLKMLFA